MHSTKNEIKTEFWIKNWSRLKFSKKYFKNIPVKFEKFVNFCCYILVSDDNTGVKKPWSEIIHINNLICFLRVLNPIPPHILSDLGSLFFAKNFWKLWINLGIWAHRYDYVFDKNFVCGWTINKKMMISCWQKTSITKNSIGWSDLHHLLRLDFNIFFCKFLDILYTIQRIIAHLLILMNYLYNLSNIFILYLIDSLSFIKLVL